MAAKEIAVWNPEVRCIDFVSKLLERYSSSFLGSFSDLEGFQGIYRFEVAQK